MMEYSCRSHPSLVYLYYCTDHDVPCCSECKRIGHKPTCNMEVLDPYTNEKDFGTRMADTLKRMNATKLLLDDMHKDLYHSRKHLSKQKDKFEADLRKFRKQMDAHLDDIENSTREKFNDCYNQEIETVKGKEAGAIGKRDAVDKWVKEIEDMARKESSLQSYVYLSKISNSFKVIEKHASKTERKIEYVCISFSVSNEFTDFLKALNLTHTYVKRSSEIEISEPRNAFPTKLNESSPEDIFKVQKIGEFNIIKDTDFHSTSDIKLLPNGDIVVANLNNRRLEVFDQDGLSHVEMELSHNPLYLSVMEDNMVAMTLSNERKIVIIDIEKRNVYKQVQMDDECHGITTTMGKLIVNGKSKGLFVLDNQFTAEKTMSGFTGKLLLHGRQDGTIICGTLFTKTIYCIDFQGSKLFEIIPPEMEYLNGIAVSNSGEIYVSGFLSNTIHKIDSNAEKCNTILNNEGGIILPRSICYDNKNDSLLVVNCDGKSIVIYRSK